MTNTIRSTAEVQADINALIASISEVDDQIFAGEQQSTDYRAILSDPTIGASNLTMLAVLRERRKSLEIALDAARKDLKGAEQNELREDTIRRRSELKALLAERDESASKLHQMIMDAVRGALLLREVDVKIINAAKLKSENVLTPNGYLVLKGIQVLNDPQLMFEWITKTLDKGIKTHGKLTWDFTNQVTDVSRNVLREWDIVNSSSKLAIIDHDPVNDTEAEKAVEDVEQFDPDPTEEDLAGIAGLPPEKAAKAMNAFANSRWGRAQGLKPLGTTPAQG